MKIKKLLSIAVMALALTSCLDHDDNANEVSKVFTYDQCFAVVQDMITGEKTVVQKPKVTIKLVANNTKFTGQVTLTNFQLPEMPNYTYELPETKVNDRSEDNIMRIEGAQMVPTNLSGTMVAFNNVKMGILQLGYVLNNQVISMNYYSLHFEYNNRYRVDVFPLEQPLYANTEVALDADPSQVFKTSDTKYTLKFDPATLKCAIEVKGAKFVAEMPAMDMKFPGISFTSNNGSLYLASQELIPTIKDVAYPQFPIADLAGKFTPLQNSTLTFSCSPAGMGLYNVTAAMQYASVK